MMHREAGAARHRHESAGRDLPPLCSRPFVWPAINLMRPLVWICPCSLRTFQRRCSSRTRTSGGGARTLESSLRDDPIADDVVSRQSACPQQRLASCKIEIRMLCRRAPCRLSKGGRADEAFTCHRFAADFAANAMLWCANAGESSLWLIVALIRPRAPPLAGLIAGPASHAQPLVHERRKGTEWISMGVATSHATTAWLPDGRNIDSEG